MATFMARPQWLRGAYFEWGSQKNDEGGGDARSGFIFEFTPAGVVTVLHSFVVGAGNTGNRPYDGLVQGSDGNFYGTASSGGTDSLGTIFQVTPTAVLTAIYNFPNNKTLGAFPRAALLQGSGGNLYGTSTGGGTIVRLNLVPHPRLQICDNVMIGGFIVGGNTTTVALRAIGSSLGGAGVTNPLTDPFREVHNGAGDIVDSNDNWTENPDRQTFINDGLASTSEKEFVVLGLLTPGGYAAIANGADGGSGVGLVEAYNLQ